MPRLKALIFDVDGTIADTEEAGHLPACNDAFAALGLPVRWTWDEFQALLAIPGNARRMRLAVEQHTPVAPADVDRMVAELARVKQAVYLERYLPNLPLRPGVRRLMAEAVARGVRLAVVSTSREDQIHALLRTQLPEHYPVIDPVLGQQSGTKTAPGSPLYTRCLTALEQRYGVLPVEVLAVEDSEPGLQAARAAGLSCAVFYNDYTFGQSFAGARLVARSLECFELDLLAALCLPADAPPAPRTSRRSSAAAPDGLAALADSS